MAMPSLNPSVLLRRPNGKTAKPAPSPADPEFLELCTLAPEQALAKIGVSEKGLTAEEAAERRARFGANEAKSGRDMGVLADLLLRFRNPLVVQLLVIAAVSIFLDDRPTAVLVGLMIILSVAISFVQERRSRNAIQKLRAMVKTACIVLRAGKEEEVSIDALVPGDLVVLKAGSLIPADLRVIYAKDLFINQAVLTGESMPLEKTAQACEPKGQTLLELPNVCLQGTAVLSGAAKAVVVRTGARTYFGSISTRLASADTPTSFDRGVRDFTWLMIRVMIVMVALIFLILGWSKGDWTQALLFGLAAAVGLTPEMLPTIVTVNLSKGAMAMSRKKVIVKRLKSIQNFGAIDVLCTDKTGTLTQNKVVLERYVDVVNRESEDVLRYAYLNSYYQTGFRNLLDQAILAHGDMDVEHACRKVDEIPFDFQRRRMSVVIDYEGDHVLICKGAVEEIVSVCDQYQMEDEVHPLIDMLKKDLLEECETLNRDGFRVLALAYREFPKTKEVFSVADEGGLTLLGYVAFFDPPKDSAAQAVKAAIESQVAVKILTGDNALVTRKVCREVGLEVTGTITGDQMGGMTEEEIAAMAEKTTIFAKLSPVQKEDVIRALQRKGRVVGFLGDGINDAPALKAADVGISVDDGADVAKESADIILLEKDLLVLQDGILEGRKVFCNITKYIEMAASSNFGNIFSLLGAAIFLPFLPMAPIQVLANNLLYDASQVAIPLDHVDADYLKRPRRWRIDHIKKFMFYMGPVSSVFDYSTFLLMLFVFGCGTFALVQGHKTYPGEGLFHTGWFVESLLTQVLVVHVIRSRKIPFLETRASLPLMLTTFAVMAAAVCLPYSIFAGQLALVPLPGIFWAWMAATLGAYLVLAHLVKSWYYRRHEADAV